MQSIDFHIHTIPDKEKDNNFTFSIDWLKNYINVAELTGIAITNHNLFDKDQFEDISSDVYINVYPGMELSLETGHVLVIYDNTDELINELSNASEKISKLNLGLSNGLSLKNFFEIFPSWQKSILVFEIGKSNNMAIPSELKKALCLGGFSSQNRFQRALNKGNIIPTLFSDAHASSDDNDPKRSEIEMIKEKHTYVESDSCEFSDLKLAFKTSGAIGVNKKLIADVYDIDIDNHNCKYRQD